MEGEGEAQEEGKRRGEGGEAELGSGPSGVQARKGASEDNVALVRSVSCCAKKPRGY